MNYRSQPMMNDNDWHKVRVYTRGMGLDRNMFLQSIKASIGYAFRFAAWNVLTKDQINFYVQGRQLADIISRVKLDGIVMKLNYSQNPPAAAAITQELKEQLIEELSTRLSPQGHLDLSNFAETNNLIWDFWLPLHRPTIAGLVDKTITMMNMQDKINSVDLSHNKLSNFNDFDFLQMGSIKVLIANDNRIDDISILEPLRSVPLSDLVVRNNTFEKVGPNDGPPPSRGYVVNEICKIFPNLLTLDSEPVLRKRPYQNNDFIDEQQYLHSKIPKMSFPPVNNIISNNNMPIVQRIPEQQQQQQQQQHQQSQHQYQQIQQQQQPPQQMYQSLPAVVNNKPEVQRVPVGPGLEDLTQFVLSLDTRLTDSNVQVEKLTKTVQDLSDRLLKTEKNMVNVEEENLRLRLQVRGMEQTSPPQNNPIRTVQPPVQQQQFQQQQQQLLQQQQQVLYMSASEAAHRQNVSSDDVYLYDRPYRRGQ